MVKVGSRVKFISDTGVGIVRSIEGSLARVEVEDGFEIPALLSDLVEVAIEQENAAIVRIGPDDPKPAGRPVTAAAPNAREHRGVREYGRISIADDYQDDEPIDLSALRRSYQKQTVQAVQSADKEPVYVAPPKAPWEETAYRVELLFVPVSGEKSAEDSDLEAYLVNDSSYTVYYNIAQKQRGGVCRTLDCGAIDPDTKQAVATFRRIELNEVNTLRISLLPNKPTSFMPQPVEAFDLELHPLKFVRPNNYTENDYFDTPALSFLLASGDRE